MHPLENGVRETISLSTETASDTDARELAALGKKAVLRRNFSPLAVLGLACTLMVTWEGFFSVFIFGLLNGGPAGLIYGFLFGWVGWAAVIATMGELVSMWPTAGGQYHWTYALAPPKSRIFLSYITGWQSVIAWQALCASAAYLTATSLQGLIINSQNSYTPRRWHGTLLVFAIISVCLVFNTFLAKQLPRVETTVLVLHIVLFVIVITVMTVMSPVKSRNEDVWTLWLNEGGYESKALSFFVGLITPVFAFSGADGAVHMCEEIKGASRVVPWALMMSILINGTTGFAMLIATLYTIGSIPAALSSPTGYPFIAILSSASRSTAGGTALSALIVCMFAACMLGTLASASRQLWAFARDNAVPNAARLAHVNETLKVPLAAVLGTAGVSCSLSLINIGSATVFNAVVSLTVAGLLGSYLIPFSLFFYKRIKYPAQLTPGPWSLGRYGVWVNGFAIAWCVVVMFFSFWPASVPVEPVNMNWSVVLWSAVILFALGFWGLHGRKVYKGPVFETGLGMGVLHEA
ncbi:amino acid transporter-like protein [Ophiobolus disseminans]|uniref:Amino acid transporter-like protein n=1 Tax=Ophiobolus disseminans TaxID=1469910 RepID=A0A6A7AHH1_9PLEO|nr:amino acid transporter-like protein [Ophiobolus disseminans]